MQVCIINFAIKYRKSSKETRGSYSFSEGPNAGLIIIWLKFGHFCLLIIMFAAGLIRMQVLFEGGFLSRIYGNFSKKNKRVGWKNHVGRKIMEIEINM